MWRRAGDGVVVGGEEGSKKQPTELCFSAMYCSQVSRRSGEFWYLQIQEHTSYTRRGQNSVGDSPF